MKKPANSVTLQSRNKDSDPAWINFKVRWKFENLIKKKKKKKNESKRGWGES